MRLRLQFCSTGIQEHYNTRLFRTKLCEEWLTYLFKLFVIEMFVKNSPVSFKTVSVQSYGVWVNPLTTGPLATVTGILASSGFSSAHKLRRAGGAFIALCDNAETAGGGAALLPAAPAPRHTQNGAGSVV